MSEQAERVTDWLIRGDIMRLSNGRTGQVVGLGEGGRVLVRLPGGLVEAWPEDDLRGTGLWLRVNDS